MCDAVLVASYERGFYLVHMQMDSGAERADPGDSEQDEEEDVYEVERIIDMRVEDVSRDDCKLVG